jgi:hypothetical protein
MTLIGDLWFWVPCPNIFATHLLSAKVAESRFRSRGPSGP